MQNEAVALEASEYEAGNLVPSDLLKIDLATLVVLGIPVVQLLEEGLSGRSVEVRRRHDRRRAGDEKAEIRDRSSGDPRSTSYGCWSGATR